MPRPSATDTIEPRVDGLLEALRTIHRGRFLLTRLLSMVPIIVTAVILTFFVAHLAPGTPWDLPVPGAGHGNLSAGAIHNLNVKYGLDQPLWRQLALFLRNAAHLDFGDSYQFQAQPARDLLLHSVPQTITLGLIAFAVILVVGVGVGLLAASKQNSWIDYTVTGLATVVASVPNFVVGITLILVLSVGLHRATHGSFYLPDSGFGVDRRLIMPLVTLTLLPAAYIARLTRTATLETIRQDHVRMARAKGLKQNTILMRHVLRNAFVPIVTTLGPLLGFLITGSIVVETLFQIPGIGGTFVKAVGARDYPVILGATVIYAIVFPTLNLLVDIAHVLIDPRVGQTR